MADFTDLGIWLEQEVTRYADDWYDTIEPDRWAANGEHHIARPDLRLGEKRIVIPRIEEAGKASIHTGRAVDVPLLKLGATADEWQTRVVIMRFEWDAIADIAAEEVANSAGFLPRRNLVQRGMDGLKKKITERIHELVAYGDTRQGMGGLLNSQIVIQIDVPAGTNVHTLGGLETYNFVKGHLKTFHKRSMLTTGGAVMLCTVDFYDALLTPFGEYNETPLDRLLGRNEEQFRYLRSITPVNELTSDLLEQYGVFDPGTNRERFVILEDRPKRMMNNRRVLPAVMRHFYPLDYTVPRRNGDTSWSVTAFEATSEMIIEYAFKVMYVNYDKFTE